jgi:hypothetical protein
VNPAKHRKLSSSNYRNSFQQNAKGASTPTASSSSPRGVPSSFPDDWHALGIVRAAERISCYLNSDGLLLRRSLYYQSKREFLA